MEQDVVIYAAGGALSGIFGAGVLATAENENVYPRVKAVYGASAGGFNLAYWLIRQTEYGADNYYDLNENFLFPRRIPYGIVQRFRRRCMGYSGELVEAVDINYALSLVKKYREVDVRKIVESGIPFYIKIFCLETSQTEYIMVTLDNFFQLLEATSSLVPYWSKSVVINGERFVDGAIKEIVGIDELLRRHTEELIVIILNHPLRRPPAKNMLNRSVDIAEGVVAQMMYPKTRILQAFAKRQQGLVEDIAKASKHPRVRIISPPVENPVSPITTNEQKMRESYKMGLEAGRRLCSEIRAWGC